MLYQNLICLSEIFSTLFRICKYRFHFNKTSSLRPHFEGRAWEIYFVGLKLFNIF